MAQRVTPREIKGADPKTFQLITADGLYAQDAGRVYYLGVPIAEADPATFEVLEFPFSQDKKHAFIAAGPMRGVERESWRPLRKGHAADPWLGLDKNTQVADAQALFVTGWSRDAAQFYFGREPIVGVDVPTFEVLSDYYAKDKDHVYSRHYQDLDVIVGADPATFVVHDDVDDAGPPRADAHDANARYRHGKHH